MPLGLAYRAPTTDPISRYTVANSFNFFDKPVLEKAWFGESLDNLGMVHLVSHLTSRGI